MTQDFTNKVALITGGTTGIGLAAAEKLALAGAKVVIAGRNTTSGETAEAQIRAKGGEVTFIQTDVSQPDQVAQLVQQTIALYGGLDYALNNAGIELMAPIGDTPDDLFEQVMAVNVAGVWHSMKHEIAHMLTNGGGVIINTSSVAGAKGMAGLSAYSASKHAVNGLTKSLALEYAQANVRINAIMPGPIATPMMDRADEMMPGAAEQFAAATAVKRVGQPDEVADAILWLFSEESSFVNAAIVPVDGGMAAV